MPEHTHPDQFSSIEHIEQVAQALAQGQEPVSSQTTAKLLAEYVMLRRLLEAGTALADLQPAAYGLVEPGTMNVVSLCTANLHHQVAKAQGYPIASVELFDRAPLQAQLAPLAALTKAAIDRVDGDRLPALGTKVKIHLARADAWVEHTVVGYYVWPAQTGSGWRVFVRVRDAAGYLNARNLEDVRSVDGTPKFR